MTGIYDHPWAYELACSFRDVPSEVDALLGWCARHRHGGGPVSAVLELAAGPAEHAREFARRGLAATALDLSPAMCRHARDRAAADGLGLDVVQADMTDFKLGHRFDLIVTMMDSTAHLLTLDAFVAHLDRAAEHLAAGGVYVIEMSHPADRLSDRPSASATWTVERGDVRATVRWGEPDDRLDPITQIVHDHVTISVTRQGSGAAKTEPRPKTGRETEAGTGTETGTETLTAVVPYRFWTATEVTAAVRLSGALRVVAQYGDFADITPSDPEAWRLITVLAAA